MADVYTGPPAFSYQLTTPFWMPSDKGDRWAVSFTGNNATLVAAALSVAITIAFLLLWNLLCFIALLFNDSKSRRRYTAFVVLWNSNDSWFAFKELLSYTYRSVRKCDPPGDRRDVVYGFSFCLLALAMFVGSVVMGILGPSLVVRTRSFFLCRLPWSEHRSILTDGLD
jgi:hypothetical protein